MRIYFMGILREYFNAVIVASKALSDQNYIQPRLHPLMHAKSFVVHKVLSTSAINPFISEEQNYLYGRRMQCWMIFIIM